MKFYALVLIVLASFCVHAGTWSEIGEKTLAFEGDIESGEYRRFSKVYHSGIRKILVKSRGGSTMDALEIGRVIFNDRLTIEVDTHCVSSCALYFFLPANKKILKNGIVGFHGSVGVTLEIAPEGFFTFTAKDLEAMNMTESQAAQAFSDHVDMERALFRLLGVSNELFHRSQSHYGPRDMGCNKKTVLLVPSIATLEDYGVKNVEGPIDPELIHGLDKVFKTPVCYL